MKATLLVLFLALSHCARAAVSVESMQMPAWLERAGARTALGAGASLREADVVQSGADSRIVLRSAEGGAVYMGSGTRVRLLGIEGTGSPPGRAGASGSVHADSARAPVGLRVQVLAGIARFDSGHELADTSVTIELGAMRASLRRGSVLASARAGAEVCLLAGDAMVQYRMKSQALQQPYTCFAARGLTPPHQAAELQQLAAQTELAPGAGRIVAASVLAPAVGWKVNVASPTDAREARALLYKLSAAGYSAEVLPVVVKGRQHHRVRITGLADRREATELAGRLGGKFVAGKPWVTPD